MFITKSVNCLTKTASGGLWLNGSTGTLFATIWIWLGDGVWRPMIRTGAYNQDVYAEIVYGRHLSHDFFVTGDSFNSIEYELFYAMTDKSWVGMTEPPTPGYVIEDCLYLELEVCGYRGEDMITEIYRWEGVWADGTQSGQVTMKDSVKFDTTSGAPASGSFVTGFSPYICSDKVLPST